MAYGKLLTSDEILKTALRMVEDKESNGLSLRAIASSLGVKAPSLYRYFPQKEALEVAVAEEACRVLLVELQAAASDPDPEGRFNATAERYLRFARERFALYAFITERMPQTYGTPVSKAVWNCFLEAVSGVSGRADDTAAAVATWSFLHGYVMLERSGAFGESGPKGGLETGLSAFLAQFRLRGRHVQKEPRPPVKSAQKERRKVPHRQRVTPEVVSI